MVQVLRLTRWEFFKLRKRWMPWVLVAVVVAVAVAVAICQAFLWGSYYEYVIRVLTAYMVVAGVAAFWLFHRQEIAGAKGE